MQIDKIIYNFGFDIIEFLNEIKTNYKVNKTQYSINLQFKIEQ